MSMLLLRRMMMAGGVIAPTYDPYFEQVVALLHMDGANGGTTFTDSSNISASYTATNSTLSTGNVKFGTAGGYLGGTTAYVTGGITVNCNGDFTAECWVKRNAVVGNDVIWSHGPIASYGYEVYFGSGTNYINVYGGGVAVMAATSGAITADGLFHHIAVTRQSGVWKVWVDGVLCGSATPAHFNISGVPVLGYSGYTGNQYLDELRITANVARYTTTFTPPTAAFPNSSNQVYATWNPADKAAAITLTNGNLTATQTVAASLVRATIGKSSGKWYWEVTSLTSDNLMGVANSSASLTAYCGGDANGWGLFATSGAIYHNGSPGLVLGTYAVNDVLGFALDMDSGTCAVYKNNTLLGNLVVGLTGTIYPAFGIVGALSSCTANFGATPFKYTIPAGFNPGLF